MFSRSQSPKLTVPKTPMLTTKGKLKKSYLFTAVKSGLKSQDMLRAWNFDLLLESWPPLQLVIWFYLNSKSTVGSRHLSWFWIFAISLFSHLFIAKFKIEVHAWFQNPRFKNSQLFILFKNLTLKKTNFDWNQKMHWK